MFSSVGSTSATSASAPATALSQVLVGASTQVAMTVEKPTSLPPMVMLTSVVLALSDDTWLLITSLVVAPAQATKLNEAGSFALAHCCG